MKQRSTRKDISELELCKSRTDEASIHEPRSHDIEINQHELTEAIDLRSINGRFLRQTRMNTDRFK